MNKFLAPLLMALLISAGSEAQHTYQKEIQQWDSVRYAFLISDTGWVNLAGLLWLAEGRNSFGTDPSNDIVFPPGTIAGKAGYIELHNGSVTLIPNPNANVLVDGKKKDSAIIYQKDWTTLPVCSSGNLRWNIKRSDDKYGIRLRDLKSPAIHQFKPIPRYPADSSWKVQARLSARKESGGLIITNVLGQTSEHPSPGKLVFELQGKSYSLETTTEGDQLFIIFGDETSGSTTYPSGRYLYASMPDKNGYTMLDFNKSINPPCAFTEFATCPLPPKQNILPVAITAGEKYGH